MPNQPRHMDEILDAAKRVSDRTRYPIRNLKQLVDAVGGEEASFDFGGQGYKLGPLQRLVPNEYFPIESHEDLVAKIADLRARAGPIEQDVQWGEEARSPADNAGQPDIPQNEIPQHRGVPAVKGWKKNR
jgi:hypothetical protein